MDAEKQKDTLHKPQIEWKNISVFNFLKKKKQENMLSLEKVKGKRKRKKREKKSLTEWHAPNQTRYTDGVQSKSTRPRE